jgi:PAS domain S-box-containing protein
MVAESGFLEAQGSLFANTRAVMFLIDPGEGVIVDANPAAAAFYGWTMDELKGMPLGRINTLPPAELSKESALALSGEGYCFHFQHRLAGGEIRDVEVYSSPVPSGGRTLLFSIVHDITERRRAEAALARTEGQFEKVVEMSPSAVFIHSGGTLTYVNAAGVRLIGASSPEELLGKAVIDFVHPACRGAVVDRIRRVLEGDRGVPLMEETWVRLDGSSVEVEAAAVPFSLAGRPGTVVLTRDVTEQKRRDHDLLAAKSKAEGDSELKSTLLANMSHEFRTPLNGILGLTDLLREEPLTPEVRDLVAGIRTSADRLHATLEDILSYAQLSTGEYRTTLEDLPLAPSVEMAVRRIEAEAQRKGLALAVSIPPEEIRGEIDARALGAIIARLLENAVKYTGDGRISITLRCEARRGRTTAHVDVADTGIGIPVGDRDVIFHPFRQLSGGYTRKYEGNGLGLTIARHLAALMHGTITVESTPGIGSTFTLHLPGCRVPGTAAAAPPADSPQGDDEGIFDVLSVEDNFLNFQVLKGNFKDLCRVDHARDAEAAILMAASKRYAVILMDINLGAGMSGVEAVAHIRSLPGCEGTPIVAVTGYALSGDRLGLLEQGFDDYVAKPYAKEEVREVLMKFRAGRRLPKAVS